MRPLLWLLMLAACSGSAGGFRGFPEPEVAVAQASAQPVDSCQVRNGRLVVEVEEVLVREYPSFGATPKGHGQRPLLVVVLFAPDLSPAKSEALVFIGPLGYQPGQSIDYFLGRRILDRPARHLAHRRLGVRVLENDSTTPPEWVEAVRKVTLAAPVAAVTGVHVPAAAIADASWLIAQLDPDDLVMSWTLDLDQLMAGLAARDGHRALRLHGVTPRRVEQLPAAPPTAELRLLAFYEPEPGCQ